MVGDPLRNLITIIMRGSLDRNFHLEIDMLMRSKHSISNWKPMMYLCKPFSYATHWGKSLGLVKKSTLTWKFKFNWWKVKNTIILQNLRDRFSRSIFIFSFSIYHHDTKKGDKNKYFKIQLRFWCQTKGFSVYWNKYFCRCYATRQSQKEQRDGDEKTIFSDVGFFYKNNRNHLVLDHPKHTPHVSSSTKFISKWFEF